VSPVNYCICFVPLLAANPGDDTGREFEADNHALSPKLMLVHLIMAHSHTVRQCSRIRILRIFQISKIHDFLRIFEMTYQKVVKTR